MTNNKSLAGICALIALVILGITSCHQTSYRVSNLEVTFISNISNDPVFSWKIDAGSEVFTQQAYQLTVSDKGSIWDSQKRLTSNSLQVRYDGPALENGKEYFARVRVWDQNDTPSTWSEETAFCCAAGVSWGLAGGVADL